MLSGWGVVVEKQSSGDFFDKRYPKCKGSFDDAKKHFGGGKCWGGELNSIECEFEGGDCILTSIRTKIGRMLNISF